MKKRTRNIFGIAIAIVVLVGIVFFAKLESKTGSRSALGTFDDPKKALVETQKALSLLSTHVNVGYKSVEYIEEYENTKNIIFNID